MYGLDHFHFLVIITLVVLCLQDDHVSFSVEILELFQDLEPVCFRFLLRAVLLPAADLDTIVLAPLGAKSAPL